MASSLHLVTLKSQGSSTSGDQKVPVATSEVQFFKTYADHSIFLNTHGIFKVARGRVTQLRAGGATDMAMETGEQRLTVVMAPDADGQPVQQQALANPRSAPVAVPMPGPSLAVRQVACGVEHCLALLQRGVVAAWGRGPQLGLGPGHAEGEPLVVAEAQVIPGLSDVLSVAAGSYHSAAVVMGSEASPLDVEEATPPMMPRQDTPDNASEFGDSARFKVQIGLSSFLFRSEPPDRRREFNLWDRLRSVRESFGSEEGRRRSGSFSLYDQISPDPVGSRSSSATPTESLPSNDAYLNMETETRSLPGISSLETEMRSNMCELAVDTAVWTWGSGKAGQLGHGETEDVAHPVKVTNLLAVVKVSCGHSHTLALTADSKVYLWGTYQKSRRALVPQLVETASCVVYDIAAGNCSSLLVGYITYQPDVFMLDKNRCLSRKTELRPMGWPVALSSTFDSPVGEGHCLVSLPDSEEQANLFEAAHELNFKLRTLFSHLHNLKLSFVDPFTRICNFDDDTALSSRLILLLNSVSVLHRTTHACVSLATMRCLTTLTRPWPRPEELAALERSLSRQLDAFRFFWHTLSDTAAWNTFEMMCRQHPAASAEALSHFVQPLPSSGRAASIRDTFTHLLMLVEMEHAQLDQLAALCPELATVLSASLTTAGVGAIHRQMKESLSDALETCRMVQGLPHAVQVQLSARRGRRLVLDSETVPLSPSNKSGRASVAQRVVLFTDALVMITASQVTAWPLSLVWIRGRKEVQEERHENSFDAAGNFDANVHFFQVATPDEMLTLFAPDEAIRSQWFTAINREINRTLSSRRSVGQWPPERRYGQYTFRSGPFRGCRYDGQWMRAMMHGEGQLNWPDSSTHRGRFRRGKITGLGCRELKSPPRTLTGEWEDGMLHGFAKVNYDEDGLKSEYQGWFSRGVREGHGVLRSGGEYLYIGEWLADRQHGYGVEEDYSAFPQYRFFGEWRNGLKHGRGSMVTVTNKYLEGVFVNGEMRGQGRIVDSDFVFTGQIINGKPNGQGQCLFKSATACVKLNGQCYGQGEGKLKFEGDVEWEVLSPTDAITMNRQSIYRYQTEDVDPEKKLPSRWTSIQRHCEHLLGKPNDKDEEEDEVVGTEKARDRAWSNLACIVLNARKRWRRGQKPPSDERRPSMTCQPHWDVLECIPAPCDRLTTGYVARAREYLLAAVEVAEHPLSLYLATMVGLIKEAYLGMGTHPQLLRHAREDVWITASGLYSLMRRLFPKLPADLDARAQMEKDEGEARPEAAAKPEDPCGVHFVGRDFVYAVLLPRVYPCLRTLYSTTLDAEEEAYRRTLRKHNRIPDAELFTLLEISGDIRERLVSEYDVIGENGRTEPTQRYMSIVRGLRELNSEEVSCPNEQLAVLMRAYDQTLELIMGRDLSPPSADDQVPVILFILIRGNITHLGATLSYIRDMTAFSCDCSHGITMYKFTTILGLYRHLVDRNGMLY